jgi:hypothetical protein
MNPKINNITARNVPFMERNEVILSKILLKNVPNITPQKCDKSLILCTPTKIL